MKIISNSALRAFAVQHPQADEALQGWRRVMEKNSFSHWAELKAAFNTIDNMETMNAHIEVKHLLPAWEVFRSATDIAPIRSEAHYRRMVEMLEALLDEAAGDGTGRYRRQAHRRL